MDIQVRPRGKSTSSKAATVNGKTMNILTFKNDTKL